jgi:Rrf2 family protein
MRVTAKAEYAVRAVMELAGGSAEKPVKRDQIVAAQAIPPKFLENILAELRHAGLVESQRGSEGGYWLSRPADQVSIADVMRVVEGPLASVRSHRPETMEYEGLATPLQTVWVALRASIRAVLDRVTIADLVGGELPPDVVAMTADPDAWVSH